MKKELLIEEIKPLLKIYYSILIEMDLFKIYNKFRVYPTHVYLYQRFNYTTDRITIEEFYNKVNKLSPLEILYLKVLIKNKVLSNE